MDTNAFLQDLVDALIQVEHFSLKPHDFTMRLDRVLGDSGCDSKKLSETLLNSQIILAEVIELCKDLYIPKFDLQALSPKGT